MQGRHRHPRRPRGHPLAPGLVFAAQDVIKPAVYVLAALSLITVGQRIFHVRSALRAAVTN